VFGTGDFIAPATATNVGLNIDFKINDNLYAYAKDDFHQNYQNQEYYRLQLITTSAVAKL